MQSRREAQSCMLPAEIAETKVKPSRSMAEEWDHLTYLLCVPTQSLPHCAICSFSHAVLNLIPPFHVIPHADGAGINICNGTV